MSLTKICKDKYGNGCRKKKPLIKFYKNGKYYRSLCIECYYNKYKDYNIEFHKTPRQRKIQKQYRENNKDKIKIAYSTWYSKNKIYKLKCNREYNKNKRGKNNE